MPGPTFFYNGGNKQPVARFFCRWLWLALLLTTTGHPAKGQEPPRDLGTTSIEDLMNIEVTTVSKKEQKLSTSPPPSS